MRHTVHKSSCSLHAQNLPFYKNVIIVIIINLLAQKHDEVTCATKQIERDSKDTDATNICPRKVQINQSVTHFENKEKSIVTMGRLKAFSVDKFTFDGRKFHTLTIVSAKYLL